MEKPIYPFQTSIDHESYFFESHGQETIQEVVVYQPIEGTNNIVELAFGNLKNDMSIDVMVVNDNQNIPLVIATVISTIFDYLEFFPEKKVFFRGSTPSRTRLYRAAISKTIDKIEPTFQVFGFINDTQIEIFNKNHTYTAYLIQRKNEKN